MRFERALGLVNKASALAREPMLLHKSSCLLGELLLQLGRTHDALTAYREALDFAIDQNGHGCAWFGIASALRIMDRHEEALEALDTPRARSATPPISQMRARIHTLRGNLCFPLGRIDACMQAHEQAHRFALQAQSHVEIARALSGLGDAYYQRGRMVTARRALRPMHQGGAATTGSSACCCRICRCSRSRTPTAAMPPRAARAAVKGSSSHGASATCAASCSCT